MKSSAWTSPSTAKTPTGSARSNPDNQASTQAELPRQSRNPGSEVSRESLSYVAKTVLQRFARWVPTPAAATICEVANIQPQSGMVLRCHDLWDFTVLASSGPGPQVFVLAPNNMSQKGPEINP